MKRYLILLAAAVICISPVTSDARQWKDKTGTHTVEAELVEVIDGQVRLKRTDGKIVRLEVAKLSAADQAFLKQQAGPGAEAIATAPKTGTSGKPAATLGKLDLTFITPEMFAAVIVHPQRISQSPLAIKLMESAGADPFAQAEQEMGVDPRSITQAMMLVPPMKTSPTDMEPGVILRFDSAVDGNKIAAGAAKEFTEKTQGGKKYYAANDAVTHPSVFVADSKTVVIAKEPLLLTMIGAKGTKSDLTDRLSKADLSNDFIAVVAIEKNRDMLKQLAASAPMPPGQPPGAAQNAVAMLDKLKSAMIALSLTGDTLLNVSVEANDAAATAELQEHATQLVATAKTMYPLFTGNLQEADDNTKKLVAIGNDAVKGLATATKGTSVSVTLKRPNGFEDLPDLVKPLVEKAVTGGFGGPPGAFGPPGGAFPPDGAAPNDANNKDAGDDLFGK